MTLELKVGCDPELFLSVGKNFDRKFVSAHGLFPGTKAEPFKVDKGAIQVDGTALEFNIEPAVTAKEFSNNIQTVLNQMKEMVKKVDKDMELQFTPFATFDVKYFKGLPEECKILGCDPDYSALNGEILVKGDIQERPFRTAAGHVHVGWTENEDAMGKVHFEDAKFIAKHFYNINGAQSKCIDRFLSNVERQRLQYYGAYGSFRPKSYGVELREFSNVWVEMPENREKMFNHVTSEVKKLA